MNWELCQTNYPHPDIKTGQHTNGPAAVWVRINGAWVDTNSTHLHCVRRELEMHGVERIAAGTWDGRSQ
jgi:hypothetical protein